MLYFIIAVALGVAVLYGTHVRYSYQAEGNTAPQSRLAGLLMGFVAGTFSLTTLFLLWGAGVLVFWIVSL